MLSKVGPPSGRIHQNVRNRKKMAGKSIRTATVRRGTRDARAWRTAPRAWQDAPDDALSSLIPAQAAKSCWRANGGSAIGIGRSSCALMLASSMMALHMPRSNVLPRLEFRSLRHTPAARAHSHTGEASGPLARARIIAVGDWPQGAMPGVGQASAKLAASCAPRLTQLPILRRGRLLQRPHRPRRKASPWRFREPGHGRPIGPATRRGPERAVPGDRTARAGPLRAWSGWPRNMGAL